MSVGTQDQQSIPLQRMIAVGGSMRFFGTAGRLLRNVAPWLALLGLWEMAVWALDVPAYLVPAPSAVGAAFGREALSLALSWWVTVSSAGMAFALALLSGCGLAILSLRYPAFGRMVLPIAVALQVTPVVAIAPLLLIYLDEPRTAIVVCAWIVAVFPILANTAAGLRSADPNLLDLLRLYEASPWAPLRLVQLPSAVPYILTGSRIGSGLALIGTVVAEFTAGTIGAESGLAYRLLEAGYRLDMPLMYAVLGLIMATGWALYLAVDRIGIRLLARWSTHEMDHAPA